MKTTTISEANAYLDRLRDEPGFDHHVASLRTLVGDELRPGEIDFLMRGMFPMPLIELLVEAHLHDRREPVIVA